MIFVCLTIVFYTNKIRLRNMNAPGDNKIQIGYF